MPQTPVVLLSSPLEKQFGSLLDAGYQPTAYVTDTFKANLSFRRDYEVVPGEMLTVAVWHTRSRGAAEAPTFLEYEIDIGRHGKRYAGSAAEAISKINEALPSELAAHRAWLKECEAARIEGRLVLEPRPSHSMVPQPVQLQQASAGRQTQNYERSHYTYDLHGDVVCVTDLNDGRTVTNDAHAVVEDLVRDLGGLSGRTVIYRDTTGIWDELVVHKDRFSGFRSVNEKDLGRALARIAVGAAA
ncbi:hypothetical protein [Methylobacterium sp. Leaf106]|uniref:hypothetical protein n=1 Tax=Methylobacterium sp. Leaf106 TaxID=1736255 RepID=UPI000A7DCF0F|nr:hypothetical protein [Methylobacterium sp. Leaf106]